MDLAAVKARLEQMNNKGKKTLEKLWKPKDEHTVRLLPQHGKDEPFIEMMFHYEIGNNFQLSCPKNYGEDCCICEFADKLRSWKDDEGKDKPEHQRKSDFEIFRKLQSKPKYFVAVVERQKDDSGKEVLAGPFFWSVTQKVYTSLLRICANDDWNEGRDDGGGLNILVSPSSAHDILVSYQPPGKKGNNTSMFLTVVEERKKPTKLHTDQKEVKRLLDAVPSIDEVVQRKTSSEVSKIFSSYVNSNISEDAAAAVGKTDVEYNDVKKEVVSNNAEKLTGKKTIDELFEEQLK